MKHFAEKEKSNLHFHNFSISPKIKRQPEANLKDLKKSNSEEKICISRKYQVLGEWELFLASRQKKNI